MKKIILLLLFTATMQSQTVTYTESFENFANPERGFFHSLATRGSSQGFGVYNVLNSATLTNYRVNEKITLIQRTFRLNDYVASTVGNPSQTIDQVFITNMNLDFAAMRTAGIKCIVRFSYGSYYETSPGVYDPANVYDPPLQIVKNHINQLMPVLNANLDVISSVEAGFIGNHGEWNRSSNFGTGTPAFLDDPANILLKKARFEVGEAILNGLSSTRMVAFRTPYFQRLVAGTLSGNVVTPNPNPITAATAYNGSKLSRIAAHNDCFLSDANDMGTYTSIPITTDQNYLDSQSNYTFNGGETCKLYVSSSAVPLVVVPQLLPSTARSQMQKYNFNNLNADYNLDVVGSTGYWSGQSGIPLANGSFLEETKRNLGYRFVLLNSSIASNVITIQIKNVGYHNVFNKRSAYLILKNVITNQIYNIEIERDISNWKFNNILTLSVTVPKPFVPKSQYQLYINVPDFITPGNPLHSIRFANQNVWESSTGFNSLNIIYNHTESSRMKSDDSTIFEVTNYPNPFTDTFMLNINTSSEENVTVKIYDMIGKLIEQRTITYALLGEQEIGTSYNAGIYNIVVTQGENSKTMRIVKR